MTELETNEVIIENHHTQTKKTATKPANELANKQTNTQTQNIQRNKRTNTQIYKETHGQAND